MAFESLSERLNGVFKKLRGKGKLSEADIKAATVSYTHLTLPTNCTV